MRTALILGLLAAATLAEAAHARKAEGIGRHRRHHHRTRVEKAKKKSGKKTSKSHHSSHPSATPAKSHGSNPTSSTSAGSMSGVEKSNIFLGFLPDEGDAGGSRTTMAQLNAMMDGQKSATYGYYAQAHSGTPFDGSQLLAVMADVKASGAIFEPAVMPTGGWQGLTASDNSQAVNICKVMKQFTDQGIEVRLRFAHEVNYYVTDGTYQGGVDDFKAGWAAVSAACKSIAPQVKMFFTPNIADLNTYKQWYPDDASSVDLCGVDFYPTSLGPTTFVDTMKGFHDFCTANGKTKFAIGETGLGYAGSIADRVSWLRQIMSSGSKLPNLISCTWFNYVKERDFRLIDSAQGPATTATMDFLKS